MTDKEKINELEILLECVWHYFQNTEMDDERIAIGIVLAVKELQLVPELLYGWFYKWEPAKIGKGSDFVLKLFRKGKKGKKISVSEYLKITLVANLTCLDYESIIRDNSVVETALKPYVDSEIDYENIEKELYL